MATAPNALPTTVTDHAALASTGAERDEAVRVFTGVLAPTGSASLVEERLLRAVAPGSAVVSVRASSARPELVADATAPAPALPPAVC